MSSPELPSNSVVIHVYNSQDALPGVPARPEKILSEGHNLYEAELVNDGCRDGNWQVVTDLAENCPWVRGINRMRSCGQHNALPAGIREAGYELIATIDDDGQNPPEEIPRLVAERGVRNHVVYGTPEREEHGLLRDVASVITKSALQKAMG